MSDEYEKIQQLLKNESDKQSGSSINLTKSQEMKLIGTDILILTPFCLAILFAIAFVFSFQQDISFWEATLPASFTLVTISVGFLIWSFRIAHANMLGEMHRRAWTNNKNKNTRFFKDYVSTLSFGSIMYVSLFTGLVYLIIYLSVVPDALA